VPQPPTILAIDDDPTTLCLLALLLTHEGFVVRQATSGPMGRTLAREQLPDLILLDWQMPVEDGLATCRQLKADPATESIPIIFVSVEQDVGVKVAALEAGAVDYITKPYARTEVLARLRLHLRLHQAQRALVETQAEKLRHLAAAQQALLVNPQDLPEAAFAACWKPRQEVGGDFYDVVGIAPQIWDYIVADVAGHDLAASLATAALKALIRQNASAICGPGEMVHTINAVMQRVYPEGPYVTLAYARLNRARQELSLVLAGHPPLIRVGADGRTQALADESELVGAFETITVRTQEVPVTKGDRLYLFTDGLIESPDSADRGPGLRQLMDLCATHQEVPLAKAVTQILERVAPPHRPARDDLLLLAIEV